MCESGIHACVKPRSSAYLTSRDRALGLGEYQRSKIHSHFLSEDATIAELHRLRSKRATARRRSPRIRDAVTGIGSPGNASPSIARKLVVEAPNRFRRKARADSRAGANPPAPRLMRVDSFEIEGERLNIAETRQSPCRAAIADGFPFRRRSSISDCASRSASPSHRPCCRQRNPVEVRDHDSSAGLQHSPRLRCRARTIEPMPALSRRHEVEARSRQSGLLGRRVDVAHRRRPPRDRASPLAPSAAPIDRARYVRIRAARVRARWCRFRCRDRARAFPRRRIPIDASRSKNSSGKARAMAPVVARGFAEIGSQSLNRDFRGALQRHVLMPELTVYNCSILDAS